MEYGKMEYGKRWEDKGREQRKSARASHLMQLQKFSIFVEGAPGG